MGRGAIYCRILVLALWAGLSMAAWAQESQELEDYELMRNAIQKGDVEGAARLLDRGVPVDIVIPYERTPLMDAVSENNPELVRLFLARGADPMELRYMQKSLWDRLHVSPTTESHQAKTLEILALLLDAGLSVDAYCDSDEGKTLLMKACQAGNAVLLERLLKEGASITLQNKWRETTALGYLAGGPPFDRKEVFACLSLLVDAGADPRTYQWVKAGEANAVTGLWGFLRHLAQTGDAQAMNLLFDRYGSDLSLDGEKASAVLAALLPQIHGDADAVRRAVEALVALGAASDVRDDRGKPVVFESRHQEAVLALLDAGLPPDTVDDSGRNLLVFCLEKFGNSFREEDYIRALVGHGVAVNRAAGDGTTALMNTRTISELALLLELGADIYMHDRNGRNALHHWVYRSNAMAEIRLLLDAGLPIDERDQWGITPFLIAVGSGALNNAAYLLDQGADVHARNERGEGALDLFLEWYLENFIVVMRPDRNPGPLSFLRLLLEKGLDPSIAPEKGDSPLSVILRKDPKAEGALAQILIEAAGTESLKAVRAKHAKEKRDDFAQTISWYPGRTAFAVALPLVICGLSIGLREGVFAGNPGANWMVGVNCFLGTAGGLTLAGGLVGGLIGYLLFNDNSVHGLGGIGIAIGIAGMAGLGAIVSCIAGSIVSFSPGVLNAYRDNAFLYYLPSGISLIVSGAILKSVFD